MNEYYIGTSAYKLEEYENQTQKQEERRIERAKNNKAEATALCRWMITGIILVFVAALGLVYLNVMTMKASTDVKNMEDKLNAVVNENKKKEIEINRKLDMKVIEKRAKEELGMQKPENSQIIYIDVKKPNETKVMTPGKDKSGFSAKIKNVFEGIEEYFN